MKTRDYDLPREYEQVLKNHPWRLPPVTIEYERPPVVVPEFSDAEIGAMVRMDREGVSTFDISTELGIDMHCIRRELLELRRYYKESKRLTDRNHPGRKGA
jgi:hypothetical protein